MSVLRNTWNNPDALAHIFTTEEALSIFGFSYVSFFHFLLSGPPPGLASDRCDVVNAHYRCVKGLVSVAVAELQNTPWPSFFRNKSRVFIFKAVPLLSWT